MGLADLNAYSEQQIEFTDNRDATVLFLVPQPEDLEFTATDTSFSVNNPYTIDEIIRPEVCLPTFSVDVSGVAGSTVAWSTIPAGSTVTVSNGVYTIDNIVDADAYDVVRYPTITVPGDFQGSFFYTVSVNYTTSAGLQTYSWEVGVQVPVAIMAATSGLTSTATRFRDTATDLLVETDINIIPNAIIVDPFVSGDLAFMDYVPGSTNKLLTAAPQFELRSATPTIFTVTITTDVPSILEAFRLSPVTTGVTFNYNTNTKTVTMSGSSANINTALQNLQIDVLDSPVKFYWNFNLIFDISNDQNEYIVNFVLPAISTDATYQSVAIDDSYVLNTPTTIQGGPKVDPSNLITSGVWTTSIRPLDPNQITSLTGGEITGYGPVTLQRIQAIDAGNETGRRVAASTNGQYLGIAGDGIHRVYYKAATTWVTQKTFDEDNELGSFIWTPDGPIFDMSDDAVYVAYGIYSGTVQSPTSFTIAIQTRSGTTWLTTAYIELVNPSYATRPTQIKLNKTGSKLAIATADGRILIYTRSGSTWSISDTITGILTKTISGTDPDFNNQAYTKTAEYTFSAFDMDPSGTYFAVAMDISVFPSTGDAGSTAATQEGLYDDRVAIYNNTTFQHDFAMTDSIDNLEYPETGDDPTSVSFNDGATSLIVCNSDVVYLTRSGSTWTDAARIDVAATNVNNSSTTATISHDGLIMAAAGKYDSGVDQQEPFVELWALINGTWEYQFTTSGTNESNNVGYEMQSVLSGNGEFFGYGNYVYTGGSATPIGETFMFTLSDFGRIETSAKELTIIAPKDDTNNLVDNFTLTPAPGENNVIKVIYETTNPNGVTTNRLQNINN